MDAHRIGGLHLNRGLLRGYSLIEPGHLNGLCDDLGFGSLCWRRRWRWRWRRRNCRLRLRRFSHARGIDFVSSADRSQLGQSAQRITGQRRHHDLRGRRGIDQGLVARCRGDALVKHIGLIFPAARAFARARDQPPDHHQREQANRSKHQPPRLDCRCQVRHNATSLSLPNSGTQYELEPIRIVSLN